jgi:hypothetical protein
VLAVVRTGKVKNLYSVVVVLVGVRKERLMTYYLVVVLVANRTDKAQVVNL